MYNIIGLWKCPKCQGMSAFKDQLSHKPTRPIDEWGVCEHCNKFTDLIIFNTYERNNTIMINLEPSESWMNDEYDY